VSDRLSAGHGTIAIMFWVMVVVVAVVVFGTAAVAAGAGGTLAVTAGDPQSLAGLDGAVGPADVEAVRFPVVVRGYRMDAVDVTLARLADELADRDARIERLEIDLGIRPAPEVPLPESTSVGETDTDLESSNLEY
jgi:DivIVA domain-containing protein